MDAARRAALRPLPGHAVHRRGHPARNRRRLERPHRADLQAGGIRQRLRRLQPGGATLGAGRVHQQQHLRRHRLRHLQAGGLKDLGAGHQVGRGGRRPVPDRRSVPHRTHRFLGVWRRCHRCGARPARQARGRHRTGPLGQSHAALVGLCRRQRHEKPHHQGREPG
ncbi:hypothetical protein D3C71_1440440 [compost metagenome]